jgi:dihydroorotase
MELMLERNLSILEYSGGKMHIPTISTKRSVELIREAKSKGLKVTAGVSVNNLFFDDSVLTDFNTNFKVDPPLRSKEDIDALKKGLNNGVIDVIVSDHRPEDIENKELEFDLASFGAIGIETGYSVIQSSLSKKLGLDKIIEIMTINPRNILNLPVPSVKEGEKANLTVFDPLITWRVNKTDFLSKSYNSPFLGTELTGRSVAIIKGSQVFLNK